MSKKSNSLIISVLIAIVLVLLVVVLKPSDTVEAPSINSDVETVEANANNETPEEVVNTATNFETLSVNDWDKYEQAEEDIQVLGEGQSLTNTMVKDPTNSDIVYLTSGIYDYHANDVLISVYAYNTSDYTFERIYKHLDTKEDSSIAILDDEIIEAYSVMGYDSGKLILLLSNTDKSQNPCANDYLIENNNDVATVALNLSSPYSGLELYTYPDEVIENQTEKFNKCLEKSEASF